MTLAPGAPELLASYASGALSEGLSLLVASHLSLCSVARDRVARLEALCGVLLCEGESITPSASCLAGALAQIQGEETQPAAPAPRQVGASVLPEPLRTRIGLDVGDIRWRFLLPGLSEYRLKDFDGEDVRLLRAKPGMRILQHTHVGDEATLILAGAMRDGDRVLERGDLALADQSDHHHPEIVGTETCICLVVLSGRMRFTGPVGRALNLFT